MVCEIVSNSSSGSMSGSQRPSAIPNRCSLAVPLTTKSLAKLRQPIRSDAAMNGSFFELRPAMTGSIKYGPNRRSYSVELTSRANVSGSISRSSFMRYMLSRYRNFSKSVVTSVARPGRPTYVRSVMRNTLSKLYASSRPCCPMRRSDAIATQFLPRMAITLPPLYSIILTVPSAPLPAPRRLRTPAQAALVAAVTPNTPGAVAWRHRSPKVTCRTPTPTGGVLRHGGGVGEHDEGSDAKDGDRWCVARRAAHSS